MVRGLNPPDTPVTARLPRGQQGRPDGEGIETDGYLQCQAVQAGPEGQQGRPDG